MQGLPGEARPQSDKCRAEAKSTHELQKCFIEIRGSKLNEGLNNFVLRTLSHCIGEGEGGGS